MSACMLRKRWADRDDIVQSLLLHARSGSGERRKVALNEVVVEALSLAYHSARAQDPNLNFTPRAAGDRRCADRGRNRGDKRLLAEFGFARSGRLRCNADRQLATPPRPQKRILPCSGLRK